MTFVEDNVTMSTMQYLENHVSYFVQQVNPLKLYSSVTNKCPKISSSLRSFVLFRGLVRHMAESFFKLITPYIGSLDKCHTSLFNALIKTMYRILYRIEENNPVTDFFLDK